MPLKTKTRRSKLTPLLFAIFGFFIVALAASTMTWAVFNLAAMFKVIEQPYRFRFCVCIGSLLASVDMIFDLIKKNRFVSGEFNNVSNRIGTQSTQRERYFR